MRVNLLLFFIFFIVPYGKSQLNSSEGDSWAHVQQTKKGTLVVYWYETRPFIWNVDGNMQGIEYEIINGFTEFVKTQYGIDLTVTWKEGSSFEDTYNIVRNEKRKGVFGASTFSITPERKKEIGFSPPYMPDITVLVTSKNIPIVRDLNEFDKIFPLLEAITIKGTTLENDLLSIKKERNIEFKIRYRPNADSVLQTIQNSDSVFGFVSLPIYMVELNKKTDPIFGRQNLFPIKREGYAFIYPKESDWNPPLQAYFSSPEFRLLSKKIIDQYFQNNVFEFMENIFYHADEVMLLTREREIQQRDLQEKDKKIEQDIVLRNFLIIGILVFLGFLVIILILYRMGRTANTALREQKGEIDKQRLELEKKNEELVNLNEEKNSLIKILAHDLRTPINQVRGLTEIFLLENKSLSPEQIDPINKIIDTTIRLNSMIGRVLDVDAIEGKRINMNFESIDLVTLLKKVGSNFEPMAKQKNIKIDSQFDQDSLAILGDAVYLTEIIENLLSNALKFSSPGQRIQLSVSKKSTAVKLCIKDEGPGLTPEDKEKLFQKFQQLSAKPTAGEASTGLGLSIVKKYTELMNGKVWCESEPGKGATFCVEFPKSND
jgi:signal transduction histidine kinase